MWSLFMWAMVRFLVAGSMLGVAVLALAGVGWVAGVPDRERAWAAAEERVVTILAVEGCGRGCSINWIWSGLTALCSEIRLKVRGETIKDEDQRYAEWWSGGDVDDADDAGDAGDGRVAWMACSG